MRNGVAVARRVVISFQSCATWPISTSDTGGATAWLSSPAPPLSTTAPPTGSVNVGSARPSQNNDGTYAALITLGAFRPVTPGESPNTASERYLPVAS